MKKKGFTLLELILVLALISIALGIAINRFSSIDKMRANNEVQNLINDMDFAKIKSITTGNTYEIYFLENSYIVKREGKEFTNSIERNLSYIRFVDFKTANDGNVIKFNPTGTVSYPGTVSIEVDNKTDEVLIKELVVRVGGGYVKIRVKK